jgi:hypothetical protein
MNYQVKMIYATGYCWTSTIDASNQAQALLQVLNPAADRPPVLVTIKTTGVDMPPVYSDKERE